MVVGCQTSGKWVRPSIEGSRALCRHLPWGTLVYPGAPLSRKFLKQAAGGSFRANAAVAYEVLQLRSAWLTRRWVSFHDPRLPE